MYGGIRIPWPRDDPLLEGHNIVSQTFYLPVSEPQTVKLQLHDAIYRLRFHLKSLIHNLSLSNSHNNAASIQKNRDDKSHRVTVALERRKYCLTELSIQSRCGDFP